MNQASNIPSRMIAVICAILFIVTAVAALMLFNLERQAFNPNTYKSALVRDNFYQNLPSLLGQMLAKDASQTNTPFVQQLTNENWATIIRTLLPPEQLQSMTEEAITQIFAYLNNETDNPNISLLPLKQKLASAAGLDAAITFIQSQPVCTADQLVQMIASFGQVLCNPPQAVLNLAKPLVRGEVNLIAANIPDQVSLVSANTQPSKLRNLRLLRLLMQLSPLIPLAFLFGITLFAVRSFKGWLAWWGWPFFITGSIGAISGFSGAPIIRMSMENYVSKHTQLTIPPELADAIRSLMDSVIRQILEPAGWQALAIAAVGLAMIILALITSQAEKQQRVRKSEAETKIM